MTIHKEIPINLHDPDYLDWINLAMVLIEKGCSKEALIEQLNVEII